MNNEIISNLLENGVSEEYILNEFSDVPHALMVLRDPGNEHGIADEDAAWVALRLNVDSEQMRRWMTPLLDFWRASGTLRDKFESVQQPDRSTGYIARESWVTRALAKMYEDVPRRFRGRVWCAANLRLPHADNMDLLLTRNWDLIHGVAQDRIPYPSLCMIAAGMGKWAVAALTALRDPNTMGGRCLWDEYTCEAAAGNGQWAVATLEALRDPNTMGGCCPCDVGACEVAAGGGRWVVEILERRQCLWSESLCAAAANGRWAIETLELLRGPNRLRRQCPWDRRTCESAVRNGEWMAATLTALKRMGKRRA